MIHPLIASWDFGYGESEVLSWVLSNPGYEAVVDDRSARKCGAALGIKIRGTLGIILLAKKNGLLRQVQPILEEMIRYGYHIAPEIQQTALRSAEE